MARSGRTIDAITAFAQHMAHIARQESITSMAQFVNMNIDSKLSEISNAVNDMKGSAESMAHALTRIGTDDMKDDQ